MPYPVAKFQSMLSKENCAQLFQKIIANSKLEISLARKLPVINRDILLCDPGMFVRYGVWKQFDVAGMRSVLRSPRFFEGRSVLVKAPVCPIPSDSAFLMYKGNPHARLYSTWRGRITNLRKGAAKIEVSIPAYGRPNLPYRMQLSPDQLAEWNNGQQFPRGVVAGRLLLEDGLWVDYTKKITKAKLWDIARRLAPLAESIDFKDAETCIKVQKQVIQVVHKCVDMITFQRGDVDVLTRDGQHTRARSRYVGDDIGRLAAGGQGHCHTTSSTMAAMLLPFCGIFGIDLKYRGGSTHGRYDNAPVHNSTEHHQWLEVTCRPSMITFVVDCYREDKLRDGSHINYPIEVAYDAELHPSLVLNTFSEKSVTAMPIEMGDIEWSSEERKRN